MVEIKTIEDKKTWDDFVTSRPEANFLQSWDIITAHQEMGRGTVRRAIYKDSKIIGVYSGFVERAKKGTGLMIAGGPLFEVAQLQNRGKNQVDQLQAVFQDMRNEAKRLGCDFVRFRPQWEDSPEIRKALASLGAQKAPFYLSVEHAGVLDISGTEEEITATFRQKARRAIRKAEKADLELIASKNPDEIDQFHKIELDHAKRQGYIPFSKKFLKTQFEVLAKNNEAELFIAKKDGEVLAENFMVFYGNEASYLYGVSTKKGMEYSAAPLLHLLAIREAKLRGITRYNFWGIVDEDDIKHRFYGVSVFKRGFGVQELKYVPAHDLVINPLRYYLLTKPIESLRRWRRKV
ncbi:peptidoglycan bridge formation glycyltransferase FemA/FemB family protein [Candidatus Saccharibacteria bacterium]|nr:peptidoglycan bridge formation glycyltransferase FemA/FemB family protein [Candidatus Saccharibacteria bacterium]